MILQFGGKEVGNHPMECDACMLSNWSRESRNMIMGKSGRLFISITLKVNNWRSKF